VTPDRSLPFRRVAFVMHSGWHFLYQRPHHFAARYKAAGVETVVFEISGVRSQLATLLSTEISREQRDAVHHVWSSIYPYNAAQRFSAVEAIFRPAVESSFDRFAERWLDEGTLLWLQGVNLVLPPELLLRSRRLAAVADVFDDFAGFFEGNPRMQARLLAAEETTARGVDLLLTSAARLEDRLAAWNPNTVLVRNGVSGRFVEAGEAALARGRRGEGGTVVAYQGAFAEWFDFDLLEAVIDRLPEAEFRLMGRVYPGVGARMERLAARPNVRMLGVLAHEDLPAELAAADVGIIPFRINDLTLATDPIKLYEYLGAGLPVVSTPMPEVVAREAEGRVRTAADADRFAEAIRALAAARWEPSAARARIGLARENTWDRRFDQVNEAIAARLEATRGGDRGGPARQAAG